MKTREQLRAERASSVVTSLKVDQVSSYVAEVRAFPALVIEAGLGSALAVLKAKGGTAKQTLYDHLSNWICESVYAEPKADLLSLVIKNSAAKLMRAQEETLVYIAWLKRLAEAREPKARKA